MNRPILPISELIEDEVHVWLASLELPAPQLQYFSGLLHADERARVEAFHFDHDRRHFVAARGILRELLGRYVNQAPGNLRFQYSDYGKPALASHVSARDAPHFNLAHSGGWAMYGFSRGRQVGVDLEKIRTGLSTREIAERFFAPGEVRHLLEIPEEARETAFFECWTRKEAFIKACGRGLSLPLHEFEVGFGPDVPAGLLATSFEPAELGQWTLMAVPAPAGFLAAVVAEGKHWRLRLHEWPH